MSKECYHKPRKFEEPCGLSAGQCEEGLACPIGGGVCKEPCVPIERTKEIDAKEAKIELKQKELEDVQASLQGAVTYYAAKLRGETQFIAEELNAYYSQKVTYCTHVDIDTTDVLAEVCNPANYEPGEFIMGYECGCAQGKKVNEDICNNNATRAEVIIHDDLAKVQKLRREIDVLVKELGDLTSRSDQMRDLYDLCMRIYSVKKKVVDAVNKAVAVVMSFIGDVRCIIIKALFWLLGKVLDSLIAMVPVLALVINTLKSNPACLGPINFKTFSLQIPGAHVTGSMIRNAFKGLLCKLATVDEALYFFNDICQAVSIMIMIANALLEGLCGNFGSALVQIVEPFVICNV